jgi:hypothetical protein
LRRPAVDIRDQPRKRAARPRRQSFLLAEDARALQQRHAVVPRANLDGLLRLVAEAALGGVDDALEGQPVIGRDDDAEIGHRVADLHALVEARAADDAIGQADGQKPVLEGAHLVRGADQHRHVVGRDRVEPARARLQPLDLLADPARLLLAVPMADQADLLALARVGPERLAQPVLVGADHAIRRREDVAGGAIVLLQPDHLGAGKILLEAQDVADFGAAPAIDRLVVVADAADVAAMSVRIRRRQQAQPEILGDIGVLILVDEDVAEEAAIAGQHVRVRLEDAHHMQQQIAEIDGVERAQAGLILGVERPAAAGVLRRLGLGQVLGRPGAVLPAVDEAGQHPRRPAFFIEIVGGDDLLDQAELVVAVEDGEAGLQLRQLGVAAQDLHADRVEGAEPGHALHRAADQLADAMAHLARGLVGEGDAEHLVGPRPPRGQQMRHPRGQRPRLAGAGAGQHQNRPLGGADESSGVYRCSSSLALISALLK